MCSCGDLLFNHVTSFCCCTFGVWWVLPHRAKQKPVSAYFFVLLHPHCNTSSVLSVSAVTRGAQEGDEGLAVRSVMLQVNNIQAKILQKPTWLRYVSPGSLSSWADLWHWPPTGRVWRLSTQTGNLCVTDGASAEMDFLGKRKYNRRGFTETKKWFGKHVTLPFQKWHVLSETLGPSTLALDLETSPLWRAELGLEVLPLGVHPFEGDFLNHRVQAQLSSLWQR